MYVALTYIPGGGLLTGFAMWSDLSLSPNVAFDYITTAETQEHCDSSGSHASIHLAGRRSGPVYSKERKKTDMPREGCEDGMRILHLFFVSEKKSLRASHGHVGCCRSRLAGGAV